MASIVSTGAATARPACGCRPSHGRQAGIRKLAFLMPPPVEAMLAIALLRSQNYEPHPD